MYGIQFEDYKGIYMYFKIINGGYDNKKVLIFLIMLKKWVFFKDIWI